MKLKYLYLFGFIFVISISCSHDSFAEPAKPYKRVVIFSGGGYEFSQFLGMMEALEESGKKPDLIIASCGGGLAAAIVANIADVKLRKEFILSTGFKGLLRASTPTAKVGSVTSMYSWYMARKKEAEKRLVPDIFNQYLVQIPNLLPARQFSEGFVHSSIPVIIVGGKALFGPDDVGKNIERAKLFREVLFTTPDVAVHLDGKKSAVAIWNQDSSIAHDVEVVTDIPITEAARSAITSPFLLPPMKFNNDYFVGGAIELYPLELARSLGDEVIMSFGDGYGDSGTGQLVKATYQYSPNVRLQAVHDLEATWWVDFSDRDSFLKKKSGLGIVESKLSVSFRMPEDDQTFNNDITAHYNYGRSRTLESLRQGHPNEKCHVRNMDKRNSSLFLRKMCGRS